MAVEIDLDELEAALAEFAVPDKNVSRSPSEDRVIAGFEEIQRFFKLHGRTPQNSDENDIFERLYAVRLQRLRAVDEYRTLLAPIDQQGLLDLEDVDQVELAEAMSDEELFAALEGTVVQSDITELRYVRTYAEKKAAEEIEHREVCENFEEFEPLFDSVKDDLKSGARETRSFQTHAKAMDTVQENAFFVINGQVAYIAELGEEFTTEYDRRDSRLRVIFDNGTESKILLRSFQRALHRDDTARVITESGGGPLFNDTWEEGDIESGTIYVLRSLSTHPFVEEHRKLIHKIGVTGGKVEARIAEAARDATYLLAEVQVVATYRLAGINRTKLEGIFHQIFASAQLDLVINDRFGHPVKPREWFFVPLDVIDQAVQRVIDGSITNLVYDPATAQLVHRV